MALPPLEIKVTADTSDAEVGFRDVERAQTALATATQNYQARLRSLAAAEKSGVVSGRNYAKAINEIEREYEQAAIAAGKMANANVTVGRAATQYGRNAQAAAGNTANLAAQFNDIGVMLAAGQSPLLLAVQQGSQINQVMGQMGTTGASRVKALGTAFMSIVSPANLLTLGIIAGGAALVQWAMGASDAADEADDLGTKMEEVEEKSRALNAELRRLRLGVSSEEVVILDAMAEKQREIRLIQQEIEQGHFANRDAARRELRIAQESLSTLEQQLQTLRDQQREKERLQNHTSKLADQERQIWETSKNVSREAERLVEEIGMAATRALVLADVDITSPIASATKEAAQLAANMGIALDAAIRLNEAGVEQGNRPRMRPMDLGAEDPTRPKMRPMDLGAPRVGGGGGGSREDRRQQELRDFIDGLQTEREILEEWRVEQLELLQEFTDKELEAIGGKNEAKLRLEEEYQERMTQINKSGQQARLSAIQGAMSDAAGLMQSGNEKLFKIGKAFALANAVVSGYEAATEAWAKGMAVGGPPVAAAFTAASLARTGALISNLQSTNPGQTSGAAGRGGGGDGGGAQVSTQRVDINIVGGNDRDRVVAKEVITALNNAQRDGFRLDPRLIGV